MYVLNGTLNGSPIDMKSNAYLDHALIVNGAELSYYMTNYPTP